MECMVKLCPWLKFGSLLLLEEWQAQNTAATPLAEWKMKRAQINRRHCDIIQHQSKSSATDNYSQMELSLISGPWLASTGSRRNASTDWRSALALHRRWFCDQPTSWHWQCEQRWLHLCHWNEALSTAHQTPSYCIYTAVLIQLL